MSAAVHPVAVVGATASGKSALALGLAERLGGEVVNADAVQLFAGMDIGSAKVSAVERARVPHHLLDVLDVGEATSVAAFQREARNVVDDCLRRGVHPILTGGSSLYVRAVIDDFEFPGTDPALRAELTARLETEGSEALHAELARVAPEAAREVLASNGRRIVRALEVTRLTGRPFRARLPAHESIYPRISLVGVDVPREILDRRIADRVDRMWEAGFVEEVRSLMQRGLADSPTAARSLGYQQVLAHLAGECTEREAREATVRGTRAFARRQVRLFGRDPRIVWLPFDAEDLIERAEHQVRTDASRVQS